MPSSMMMASDICKVPGKTVVGWGTESHNWENKQFLSSSGFDFKFFRLRTQEEEKLLPLNLFRCQLLAKTSL
jgi:hypothetical protein